MLTRCSGPSRAAEREGACTSPQVQAPEVVIVVRSPPRAASMPPKEKLSSSEDQLWVFRDCVTPAVFSENVIPALRRGTASRTLEG